MRVTPPPATAHAAARPLGRRLLPAAALLGAAAAGGWAARRPGAAASGFGPVRLGMSRAAALRAAGPDALPAPLCGGVEGVLFDHHDPALSPVPGRPVPAMAMFGGPGGAVSELEATLTDAAGGRDEAAWRALVASQAAALSRRFGAAPVDAPPEPPPDPALARALGHRWRLPDGAASLESRWMRRSGASFARLHWLEAGARAVIPAG